MSSPTQRTNAYLRERGYTTAITEKWNPFARIRQDLFGFADLVAIAENQKGVLAVQTTSGANHSARRAKILSLAAAHLWMKSGNTIAIISWSKKGPRGKRKQWDPRVETMRIEDFEAA